MRKHEIATIAVLTLPLLPACTGDGREVVYSQPRAISADMDASLHRAPTLSNPAFGSRFTDDTDSSLGRDTGTIRPALGFR
jgi:hypothetical protein